MSEVPLYRSASTIENASHKKYGVMRCEFRNNYKTEGERSCCVSYLFTFMSDL